jgi:hypothetical protein
MMTYIHLTHRLPLVAHQRTLRLLRRRHRQYRPRKILRRQRYAKQHSELDNE